MRFFKVGEYLAASRITGPRHNLLQIRLSLGTQETVICDRLPIQGACNHEPLNEQDIIGKVLEGITEANNCFGKNYCVTHIRYVPNDTKPESVYGLLALKIIQRIEEFGEFDSLSAIDFHSF